MTPVKGSLNPQRGWDPQVEKHCTRPLCDNSAFIYFLLNVSSRISEIFVFACFFLVFRCLGDSVSLGSHSRLILDIQAGFKLVAVSRILHVECSQACLARISDWQLLFTSFLPVCWMFSRALTATLDHMWN